ncbi:redoxin domain-containing protein [Singulisphaera sp. Ch08]|uniref:Redoxin domain-containing protein n=1 Tax=Singulisphaera sp. Ch08 TaxID=3120278 RepID=A0AAU7CNC8_9BACT
MRRLLTVLAACLMSMEARGEDILNLGDPAPPLAVGAWVKGEKVEKFDPGKIYVVEFWSTWCIPCRDCYPHLSELAHKYRSVGFLGVSVWEPHPERVKPFVEEMGDKMDFSVATDSVPESGDEPGVMARKWLQAAEEHAIPVAFIVRGGKIAWIGHPLVMDEPLAKVVAGTWDPTAAARERLAAKTREQKLSVIRSRVFTPYEAGDYKAAVTAIDQGAADEPELAEEFVMYKFAALCNSGDVEAGLELGAKLLEANKDNPRALNFLASHVTHNGLKNDPNPRVARFALHAARRAMELKQGEELGPLETLAQVLLRAGDPDGAVATAEKALMLIEKQALESKSYIVTTSRELSSKRVNESLNRYRSAARSKGRP